MEMFDMINREHDEQRKPYPILNEKLLTGEVHFYGQNFKGHFLLSFDDDSMV